MTADGSENEAEQVVPFGPFWLERRLAVGGTAEVYLARPRQGDRPAPHFVVKRVVNRSDEQEGLRMLTREAELNQAVRHKNVVQVYGAGEVAGEAYLAMEYVEGVDLYRLLRRAETEQRRLPQCLALYLASEIASALEAVHSATDEDGRPLEIVHRDVTPSNIYLSVDGAIKLGDFGIARVMTPRAKNVPNHPGLKGKFGYLAPEQIAGEPFDHRADLFALGVIFGEMLIGERVFPGSGQLAVLLAIRDGNMEPLNRHQRELSPSLYQLCTKALAQDPAGRFQSAAEFCAALEREQTESRAALDDMLRSWVTWAADSAQLARRLRGKIRDSVEKMRAVRLAQSSASPPDKNESGPASAEAVHTKLEARVRYASGVELGVIGFPRLVEMIAIGELGASDEVALSADEPYRPIRDVELLARHLLPSTSATTCPIYALGVPDYRTILGRTSMFEVLARLRSQLATGVLFVERSDKSESGRRKEIYLKDGRLLHVAASERDELLGEYLIRRGALTRAELESALERLASGGGRLGDTLVSMGVADAVDVFRAIRDLGRDRVAAICEFTEGQVTFYQGCAPSHVEFPLDLDLASPMMAGVFVASHGEPRELLPLDDTKVVLGQRAPAMSSRKERGTAPLALLLVQRLATRGLTLVECLDEIVSARPAQGGRSISHKEACAAMVVARWLGWISY